MSLFVPVKRATLLVPSGPEQDPNRKHLFILLTDPQPPDQSMLLVGVASIYNDIPHDSTCYLYPGDHPFIRRKSYVYYARARSNLPRNFLKGQNED